LVIRSRFLEDAPVYSDLVLAPSFSCDASRSKSRGPLGRSRLTPERATVPHRSEKSAEATLCAEQRTGQEGSSPSGARMRGAVSESGGNASLAGERAGGMVNPTRARRRKPETAKGDLKPPLGRSSEGRVSTVRWNPKGMRSRTGPQSMGATPTMNRSAKGGARSSRHYGDEGVLSLIPLACRVFRVATPNRPGGRAARVDPSTVLAGRSLDFPVTAHATSRRSSSMPGAAGADRCSTA